MLEPKNLLADIPASLPQEFVQKLLRTAQRVD